MRILLLAVIYCMSIAVMMAGPGGDIEMTKGIVYCEHCSDCEHYDAQCPNDVRDQTEYEQTDDGLWICPQCAKDFEREYFPERFMEAAEYRMDSLMDR